MVSLFLVSAEADVLRDCMSALSSLMHIVATVDVEDEASMDATTNVVGLALIPGNYATPIHALPTARW